MKKLISGLFFLLGIFCTMIVFKPYIFGIPVPVVHLLTFSILILMLINCNFKIDKSIFKSKLIIFFYVLLISSILSIFFLPSVWSKKSLSYAIQLCIIWLPFLILLYSNTDKFLYKKSFLKGFKISILIHTIWGTLEVILWNTIKFKLNEEILAPLLKTNLAHHPTSFTYVSGSFHIRPSGINFEPAYLGILLLIGFFIIKSKLVKIFFIFLMIVSLSRTAILGLLLISIYKIITNRKKYKNLLKPMVVSLSFIIIFFICLQKIPFLQERVSTLTSRMTSVTDDTSKDGTDRHLLYYPLSIKIMMSDANVLQLFLGYGARISGYPFQANSAIAEKIRVENFVPGWSVESDLVDIFLSSGLIGFFLYYTLLLSNIKLIKDNNLLIMNLSLLICGITYGFYSLTFFTLILIFSEIEKLSVIENYSENKLKIPNESNNVINSTIIENNI
ncbi:MAG: O-antigen ligase family protein [Bacilli bacterium]|nr:O-antigen ligase family protein [Bacilli bacterium]